MSRHLALALALVLVALVLYLSGLGAPDPSAAGGEAADVDPIQQAPLDRPAQPVPAPEPGRAPAGRIQEVHPDRAATGDLRVQVVWADDTPAPAVAVTLAARGPGQPAAPFRRGVADAAGIVTFAALRPGAVAAATLRGGTARATVAPGAVAECRLQIPAGVDVEGLVVDPRGVAVGGAAIWLTTGRRDWLGGSVVAHADAAGRFRIRAAPEEQSVGAFAPGFGPSALADLEECDRAAMPVEVRLQLRDRGGAVTGAVTRAGVAVEGALVCVGKPPRSFVTRTHSRTETWTPRTATSDAAGAYTLRALPPGRHPVVARAPGCGWWSGEVRVEAGAVTRLDVALPASFAVAGTVRDARGAPQPGAVVRAFSERVPMPFVQSGQFDYHGAFPYPYAVCDAAGRYRVEGLTPGEVHLWATPPVRSRLGVSMIHVGEVLRGAAGDTLRWDPVLAPGHTIEGVVTYRDGKPMPMVFVTAHHSRTGVQQALTADEEGRFRFLNLDPVDYRLAVQVLDAPEGVPPLEQDGVFPGRGTVRLVAAFDGPGDAPPGSVAVRLHDAAGRLRDAGSLSGLLQSENGWWRTARPDAGGVLRFGGVAPGRYKVVAKSGDDVIHAGPWFEVTPAQTVDLGTLTTQPGGTLRIRVKRGKGTEAIEPVVLAMPEDTNQSRQMQVGSGDVHVEPNLCAGTYKVLLQASGMATVWTSIDVRRGEISELEVDLVAAALCSFRVELPKGRELGRLTTTISDVSGRTHWKLTEPNAPRNPYTRRVNLPPGSYSLAASTTAGMQGETRFTVTEDLGKPVQVTLRVR